MEVEGEATIRCPLCDGAGSISSITLKRNIYKGHEPITLKYEDSDFIGWMCPVCEGQGEIEVEVSLEFEMSDYAPERDER